MTQYVTRLETKLRKTAEAQKKHTGIMTHCSSCKKPKHFKNLQEIAQKGKKAEKKQNYNTAYKIKKDKFRPLSYRYYCSQKCKTAGEL